MGIRSFCCFQDTDASEQVNRKILRLWLQINAIHEQLFLANVTLEARP